MPNSSDLAFDFFAIGEALVDLISESIAESLEDAKAFRSFIGGQPTNLTMTMAQLGNRVALAACLGEDGFGRHIQRQLDQAGVNTGFVQFTSQAPTTLVVNTRQTKTPDFAIYRGADSLLRPSQDQYLAAQNSKIVHTSAFALGREPARSTILQSLDAAHENGNVVTLDPNYHPRNWPDVPDFTEILHEAFQFVDITKPSIEDCSRLIGPNRTLPEYAAAFLEWGARIVLITQGSSGVFLATADGDRYHVRANPTPVVDVTGAGDAFWAGFLTACLEGADPLEAALLGQVVAEIKLKTLGPVKQLPERESLNQLAQNVQYSPVPVSK